jgi:hypothetical protein
MVSICTTCYVGASTSGNPKGLHGLYRDNFTLPYLNILKLCILPTECICVSHMVLTINRDSFPK